MPRAGHRAGETGESAFDRDFRWKSEAAGEVSRADPDVEVQRGTPRGVPSSRGAYRPKESSGRADELPDLPPGARRQSGGDVGKGSEAGDGFLQHLPQGQAELGRGDVGMF